MPRAASRLAALIGSASSRGPGWAQQQVQAVSPQPPRCQSRWPPQRLARSGHLASHCLHLHGHSGAGLGPTLPVLALLPQAGAPDRWPQQRQGGEMHFPSLQSWPPAAVPVQQALGEPAWGWQPPAAGLPAAEWMWCCCWHGRQAVAVAVPHEAVAGAEPRHLPEQQHPAQAAHPQQGLNAQQKLPPLKAAWHPGQAGPHQELQGDAAPAGGPA